MSFIIFNYFFVLIQGSEENFTWKKSKWREII